MLVRSSHEIHSQFFVPIHNVLEILDGISCGNARSFYPVLPACGTVDQIDLDLPSFELTVCHRLD